MSDFESSTFGRGRRTLFLSLIVILGLAAGTCYLWPRFERKAPQVRLSPDSDALGLAPIEIVVSDRSAGPLLPCNPLDGAPVRGFPSLAMRGGRDVCIGSDKQRTLNKPGPPAALLGIPVGLGQAREIGSSREVLSQQAVGVLAAAAREIGDPPLPEVSDWLTRRRDLIADGRSTIRVGHVDLLARPTGTR